LLLLLLSRRWWLTEAWPPKMGQLCSCLTHSCVSCDVYPTLCVVCCVCDVKTFVFGGKVSLHLISCV